MASLNTEKMAADHRRAGELSQCSTRMSLAGLSPPHNTMLWGARPHVSAAGPAPPARRATKSRSRPSACAGSRQRTGQVATSVRSRSEEHTSELQSLMRISYAVFCLKKTNKPSKEDQLQVKPR